MAIELKNVELGRGAQGLAEMLENTASALTGTRSRMATLQQKIAQRQEDIAHVDGQSEVQEGLIADVEAAIKTAEKALKHLKASAKVAQGTTLEESSAADVEAAERDLEFQRQLLVSHRADRASQQKRLAKDRATAEKAVQKLEEELADLQEQEAQLVAVYQKTHRELGPALYKTLAEQVQTCLQTEADVKEALHGLKAERLALQESLPQKLAEWPDLAKRSKELDDAVAPEPKLNPSIFLAAACIDYLRKLAEYAPSIETPRGFNDGTAEWLLAVPLDLVQRARFDPQRIALLADRIKSLDEFKRQTEMMLNDRRIFASIQR